jgi:hypothetical protein
MGDGMSDASSICATSGCGNVTRGSHTRCWSCRELAQAQEQARIAAKTQAATEILRQLTQNAAPNGDSPMSNKTKKPQASAMLVFPGPDGRRYRIVSFVGVGGDPIRVEKYVLDEEREDTVGDKFWYPTTAWEPSRSDVKLADVLMAAIQHLMNPNALMANDAELEGRKADAATIMSQPTPTKLQATCRDCGFQFTHTGTLKDVMTSCPHCNRQQVPNFTADAPQCDWSRCRRPRGHVGNHVDQQGEPIMCSSNCGRAAGHGGKCFEAHP